MDKHNNPLDDWSVIPAEELKRRLLAYKGPVQKHRPKPGEEKSTKIRIWDITRMCNFPFNYLYDWLYGIRKFGPKNLRKISRIIRLCDAGMVTKEQWGVYHFHDEPVAPPRREMKIVLTGGKVGMGQVNQEPNPVVFPDLKTIFGSVKK